MARSMGACWRLQFRAFQGGESLAKAFWSLVRLFEDEDCVKDFLTPPQRPCSHSAVCGAGEGRATLEDRCSGSRAPGFLESGGDLQFILKRYRKNFDVAPSNFALLLFSCLIHGIGYAYMAVELTAAIFIFYFKCFRILPRLD